MDVKIRQRRKGKSLEPTDSPDSFNPSKSVAVNKPDDAAIKNPSRLTTAGYFLMQCSVTVLAFLSRCWGIADPPQVVFDEVHFGKFASYYLRREYFFDVHPPLGKLLLAAAAWGVGYDGHFLFDNIGDDYYANQVPFVAMRLLPATCGSLIVPVVFLILKELGLSCAGATFGALLIVLDNSLITQSRLILLDSMLTFFCVCSVYTWIKFFKQKQSPFSFWWFFWLSATGLALACTLGVKMVGLFTVVAIGVAVLIDLWNLLDYRRGLTMRQFAKHFFARALCLIFLPLFVYLSFFYIHFAILIKSGPGDVFMTPKFQEQLIGSEINVNATWVPYFANITIRHRDTSAYLHSHVERYPLRYEDGRISSQGQQVTGYPHKDMNNLWTIEAADAGLGTSTHTQHMPDTPKSTVRYLRYNDLVRLRHVRTNSYLLTHDVASPLTPTHMEMTTVPSDQTERSNETVWRIETLEGQDDQKVKSKRGHIRFINAVHNVALHCHTEVLPDWAFGQQQVNGNKALSDASNMWWIDEVHHAGLNGTGSDDEKESEPRTRPRMSFLKNFMELQTLMITHNAALTKPHPYSSTPVTWPFVIRGISFWERKEGLRQIYLLGNPLIWWASITGTAMYATMWIMDRLLLRRGIDDFGTSLRLWWDRAIGFLFLCWVLHWAPFFLMGRMLFLHHYLPSFIFSVLVTVSMLEFVCLRAWVQKWDQRRQMPAQAGWVYISVLAATSSIVAWAFFYFAPLTYGTGFVELEELRRRKWIGSWDLQHA